MQVGDRVRYTAKAKAEPGICVDAHGYDLHLRDPANYPHPMTEDRVGTIITMMSVDMKPLGWMEQVVVEWRAGSDVWTRQMSPYWLEVVIDDAGKPD